MANWRRTESRVVRPFASAEDALREVRFRLRNEEEFDDRTSFDGSHLDPRDLRPEFALNVNASALDAVRPIGMGDLCLVVRLADGRLRRSEQIFASEIEAVPERWAVPPEVKSRFSWNFDTTASVALVLRSDRRPEPGLPFRRGHWVARKDFSIRSNPEPRAFPVERWAGEDFVRRGLPRDTAYWIDFLAEDLNARFEDPSDAFRVCLRADLYDALLDGGESPGGRAVTALIVAEILTEVLWRGLDRLSPDDEILTRGLLHAALARVTKKTGADCGTLRQLVAKKELSSLRAYAQAAVDARRDLARLRTLA